MVRTQLFGEPEKDPHECWKCSSRCRIPDRGPAVFLNDRIVILDSLCLTVT